MKKLLFLAAIFVLFSGTNLIAQEQMRKEKSAEVQTQRKKFYERELQFTDAESKVFWPIYESHRAEMKKLSDRKNQPKLELMSDAEAETYLDRNFEQEEEILAKRKKFAQSLKGKVGVRKIAMLPQTERKFKKELLRFLKRERGENRGDGQKGGGKRRF